MANRNLISLFDFYLAGMLLLSVYRRRRVYADGVRLFLSTFTRRPILEAVITCLRGCTRSPSITVTRVKSDFKVHIQRRRARSPAVGR